jgi:hypothetical protein
MQDLDRATITETMYLRKWADGQREAGALPHEIIVVETVSEPDMQPVTTQRLVTDTAEIRVVNALADEVERKHTMGKVGNDGIDWDKEVAALEKRVAKWEKASKPGDGKAAHPKLAPYRERLAHAKKMAAETAKAEKGE